MNFEQTFAVFHEAAKQVCEAITKMYIAIMDAVHRAFAPLFEHIEEITQAILSRIEAPMRPIHILPRLTPHMQSWAYYSASFYRYKRAYRKQRTWRNLR